MGATADKARKARNLATETSGGVSRSKTEKIAKGIAKTAGTKLTRAEVNRAANVMQPRRQNDRDRTATRATFIAGPNSPVSKRAAAKRMEAASGGAPKKAAPIPKFTAPTLAEYKSSAAYKAGDLTYKQYIAASKNAFDIKNKRR
jgi:hypothetical protein